MNTSTSSNTCTLPRPDGPALPVAGRTFHSLSELEEFAGVRDRFAFWQRFLTYPAETCLRRGQDELHRLVHAQIRRGEIAPTETDGERTLRELRQAARGFLEPDDPGATPFPVTLDALADAADAARAAGASTTDIIDASDGLEH